MHFVEMSWSWVARCKGQGSLRPQSSLLHVSGSIISVAILAPGVRDILICTVFDSDAPLQVARKHAEELPLEGSLGQVAAAARVSVGAMQGEATDLSASCAQLQCLQDSLSEAGPDPFIEVGCESAHCPDLCDCFQECLALRCHLACSSASMPGFPKTPTEGLLASIAR